MNNPNKKRLRRTMMFLNAQKPGLIKDPYIYKADSLMLDLEDAVAEKFALALTLGGAWRHRHGLSDAADVLCALMLTFLALLVLIHSGEGLRLYALLGLLLGAVLWETGIRRILRWIGKRLKKSFPSGRNMQNHSE